MIHINGTVKPGYEAVSDAFAATFEEGFEVGASVAVMHKGEMVVDIWAGHTDLARTTDWKPDTLVNVWSSTKTMMFLVVLSLADKGELSLNDPVYKYWPEFKANGKEGVLVRHLMAHTAGLSGWDQTMSESDLWDHDKCSSALAAQAPWWTPGSASGYHAITQGYLIGELVKRVTGESLGTYFRKNFAEPLGADFFIGAPADQHHRISDLITADPLDMSAADPASLGVRTFGNPMMDGAMANTQQWRMCESPAANGQGNARSLALLQSIISHGGTVMNKTFLSPAGCEALFEVQADGPDLVLGIPMKFGMGYGLNSEYAPVSPNPRACFWAGWGGSFVVNDLDAQFTYAYAMNRMGSGLVGDLRSAGPLMALHGAIA